jgi:hypothetical protein
MEKHLVKHFNKLTTPEYRKKIKMLSKLDTSQYTEEELTAYFANFKEYWDTYSILKTAADDGFRKGEELGMMLATQGNKMSIEQIMDYSGLTRQEVLTLLKKIGMKNKIFAS